MYLEKPAFAAGIVVGAALLSACLSGAPMTPARPESMPQNAIWIPGPGAPLDRTPRGVWLACWLDRAKSTNRCKVADYKGNIQFDEDFLPIAGSSPIPSELLHLRQTGTMDLWTWVEKDSREVPIVRLENGVVLVPARDIEVLRKRLSQ
jgi:hypothetical protein